jgi:hypothetical protein
MIINLISLKYELANNRGLNTKNNKVSNPIIMYKPYVVIIPVSNLAIFSPVFVKELDNPYGPISSITPLSNTLEIM